jgi:HEAT repeat protein
MWHRARTGQSGPPEATGRLTRIRALADAESSLGVLVAATGDISIEVVREALRRLAQLGGAGQVEVLRWRIWRADPSLVAEFAACIAALGDRDAIEEALAVLAPGAPDRHSYWQRVTAVSLLAAFADPASAATLRAALADPIASVRQAAVSALRRLPADADTQRALARCLADSDPQVRASAVASVAALCPDAPALLPPLAHDESGGVRRALAHAAGRLDARMVGLLLSDSEVRVRELAAGHAGARGAGALARAMRTDTSVPVRMAAARRLGEIEAAQATDELLAALADRDPLVRVTALRSLELIHGQRPLRHLLAQAVRDRTREDRVELVFALGRLGAADELKELECDLDVQTQAALDLVRREPGRPQPV